MRDLLFKITTFIEPTATMVEKTELPLWLKEAFPITMETYHPLYQYKRQGAAYLLVIVKYCLQLFYIIPGRAWSDADITELLSFRSKSFLAGDLNAKHPFWNSAVSNTSYEKLVALFDLSNSKLQHHNAPLITLLREMVTC
jgi:hypothetical protein